MNQTAFKCSINLIDLPRQYVQICYDWDLRQDFPSTSFDREVKNISAPPPTAHGVSKK